MILLEFHLVRPTLPLILTFCYDPSTNHIQDQYGLISFQAVTRLAWPILGGISFPRKQGSLLISVEFRAGKESFSFFLGIEDMVTVYIYIHYLGDDRISYHWIQSLTFPIEHPLEMHICTGFSMPNPTQVFNADPSRERQWRRSHRVKLEQGGCWSKSEGANLWNSECQ